MRLNCTVLDKGVPVTVIGYVPAAALCETSKLTVDVHVGEHSRLPYDTDTPVGTFVAVIFTDSVLPVRSVLVTDLLSDAFPLADLVIVRLPGEDRE